MLHRNKVSFQATPDSLKKIIRQRTRERHRSVSPPDPRSQRPGLREKRELGTAGVFFSVTEKLAAIHQRRKVLVDFSDAERNSSEHDILDEIEAAQNADVLIYAIRYTELNHGKMDARDRYGMHALDHLSTQTGGKTFDFHATNLKQDFTEIAGDLRSVYELAYQSTSPTRDGA